jgi:hypothetical protein
MNTIRASFTYSPASSSTGLNVSGVRRHCGLPAIVVRTRGARSFVAGRKRAFHHPETWYRSQHLVWQWTEFWETALFTLLGASAAVGVAMAML